MLDLQFVVGYLNASRTYVPDHLHPDRVGLCRHGAGAPPSPLAPQQSYGGSWLRSVWCLLGFFTDLYNPLTMISAVADSSSWLWLPAGLVVVALVSLATHLLAWGASFLSYRQIASADATITISFSDDAIQVRSNVADSTAPWASVKRIIREKDHLMLPISKR